MPVHEIPPSFTDNRHLPSKATVSAGNRQTVSSYIAADGVMTVSGAKQPTATTTEPTISHPP